VIGFDWLGLIVSLSLYSRSTAAVCRVERVQRAKGSGQRSKGAEHVVCDCKSLLLVLFGLIQAKVEQRRQEAIGSIVTVVV
jgi:hypothetical protein